MLHCGFEAHVDCTVLAHVDIVDLKLDTDLKLIRTLW